MENLKSAIYASGYNQKEFAAKCGISNVWLTQIIKKKGKASKSLADKIEKLLQGAVKAKDMTRCAISCPFCSRQMSEKRYHARIEELSK